MASLTISIDAMGGDEGLLITVPAALRALKYYPELSIILVGDTDQLSKALGSSLNRYADRLSLKHATEVVGMGENPLAALRHKKNSSMRVAINLIHSGEADACVSAGNTGALVATAHFVLKPISGVERCAILARIPSDNPTGCTRMLDLGAQIEASSMHLIQFAIMAAVMTELVEGIERPRIGLLNIGTELIKGSLAIREAAYRLEGIKELNYMGFAEGNDIFGNKIDIIVTDGFSGNIALKTSEGLASFIRKKMKSSFTQGLWAKGIALLCWPLINRLRREINPSIYNGASLIGLQGIVVKSHGKTTVNGFLAAITRAKREAECRVPERIADKITEWLKRVDGE